MRHAPRHADIAGARERPDDERDSHVAVNPYGSLSGLGETHSIHIDPDGTVDMVSSEPHSDGGNVVVPPGATPNPPAGRLK